MKNILLYTVLILGFIGIQANSNKATACHAIALVNFNQQTINANDIFVNAASDSPTCGCAPYWLDCEVRCLNEAFDGAPFNPGFHGPLTTYPYFQSATMEKPNCAVVNYPGITIPFANLCPGMTYQYRMRENHHGQVGPWCATQTFTVPGATQPIVAGASATQTTICAGDCVTLDAFVAQGCGLAASYTWDNGLGAGQQHTVCPAATTTYTVTIDEQCSGFQDQASVTINIVPPPVNGNATISATNICAGTPIDLEVTGHSGTVQWQSAPNAGGPWTNIAGATNAIYNDPGPTASTCYRAEITGCAPPPAGIQQLYSNVVCVTVDPAPTADFTFNATCGQPTAFFDQSGSGSGIAGWEWDFDGDGVIDDIQQNPTYQFMGAGPFNVTLIVTNPTGCTDTVTLPVTSPPGGVADWTYTAVCDGAAMNFTDASVANGSPIVSWDWDFDNDGIIDNTNQNPSHTFPGEGVYTVSMTSSDAGGCSSTFTQTVEVYPNPVADIIPQSACLNDPAVFLDNSTVSNLNTTNNIIQWDWDLDISTSNQQNPPAQTYTVAGQYNISLTVTTDNGCTDQITMPIDIYDKPVADFNFADDCVNQAIGMTDASTVTGGAVNSWSWDVNGDNVEDYNTPNINHQYGQPGTYNVTLIAASGNGCADTVTYPVTAYDIPTASFTTADECIYDQVCFNSNASITAPETIISHTYTFGDGSPLDATQNPCHQYAAAGQYFVTQIVTSNNGCADDTTIQINVYPQPTVNFTAADVCENQPPTVFNNTSNIVSGSITQWNWNFDDGSALSAQQNPSHNYATTGTYNVTLIGISDQGCSDTITNPVNVLAMPTAIIGGMELEGCHQFCTTLNADASLSNSNAITNWAWDLGNGNSSTLSSPQPCYNNLGVSVDEFYDVTLIVTNDLGCKDTVTEFSYITVHPNPIADFSAVPPVSNEYEGTINFVDESQGADTYYWTFGDGENTTDQNPSHTYIEIGYYTVTQYVTTQYGCTDSISSVVEIQPVPTVYVPNAFTPDGDGINDEFIPVIYGMEVDNYEFYVFDRWGQIIFQSTTPGEGWNGSVRGMQVDSKTDVYVWKLIVTDSNTGDKQKLRGHVTLLK